MALSISPHFLLCLNSMKQLPWSSSIALAGFGVQHTRLRRSSCSANSTMSLATESSSIGSSNGTAILWYKHDLRIDDHPGFLAASQHPKLLPLYIFDRRILSRFSNEMLEILLVCLDDLRKSLKDQGSNLMIRFGSAEIVIEELVKEVQVESIYTEEEIEYDLRGILDAVKEISFASSNASSLTEGCPKMVVWNTPFYNFKDLEEMPVSYNDFKKLRLPIVSPILHPKLPGPPQEIAWGALPTLDALLEFLANDDGASKRKWTLFEDVLVKNELQNDQVSTSSLGQNNKRKRAEKSVFITQQGYSVGGGTTAVLNGLAAYLRYQEGTARYEWQEVHEKLRESENREGASFGFLFGSALLLGIISRRRVHYEAIKYEKERNGGFLSPFGYSAKTIAAAVETVCSMEADSFFSGIGFWL